MPLSVIIGPGYNFSDGEKVTYTKLNMLGSPAVTFTGSIDSNQIADGAVLTSKLEQGIDINSKISDHNLDLTKLETGTQGQLLYYNADGDLVKLSPGSDGQFLKTKGAGANPEWAAQDGTDTINISQLNTDGANKLITTDSSGSAQWIPDTGLLPSVATSGAVAYFDGSAWIALGIGASGTSLQSNGSIPVWQSSSSAAYSAKGRFACTGLPGSESVSITGQTNIASATYVNAGGGSPYRQLTVTFTTPVSVDLPVFTRCEYGSSTELEATEVKMNSRTTSGIVVRSDGNLTDPVFNLMITS